MQIPPSPAPPNRRPEEAARVELARISLNTCGGSLREALRSVAECASRALRVPRVSLWVLHDAGRLVRCECLHEDGRCSTDATAVLRVDDFPGYFRALAECRVVPIASDDRSGLLEEFRGPYMEPLGILAMLDAAVYRGGRMTGIVCHEHRAGPRLWSDVECDLAGTVADTIARLYEEHERATAQQEVVRYHDATQRLQHLSELGRLAAGIAHDINNVLTAVLGNAELLALSEGGPPADSERLRGLLEAAGRGAALTKQLAQLARVKQHAPRVIDLRDLLFDFERVLRAAAGPQLRLEMDLAPTSPVFIDPSDVERSVLNLISNARDVLPEGGRIRVSLTEAPQDGDPEATCVSISVTDDGPGMDDGSREHAFEPFFTTKGGAGTGLGLAIVRQAVVLAGGSVAIESTLGQGTTVHLHLPAIGAPQPPPDTAPQAFP